MVDKRPVVANGSLSVFVGGSRVRVGSVDLRVPLNDSVGSPELYGVLELFPSFFKCVKANSRVYLAVWSVSSSDKVEVVVSE